MFGKKNDNEELHPEGMPSEEPTAGSDTNGSPISPQHLKPSIISEGFEFIGEMKSNGSITVDGTFKGTLSVQSLLIGASGNVDGTITADNINVKGQLSGTLDCRDLVIGGRALVDGKLSYSNLTIQRGGVVKGELKRK